MYINPFIATYHPFRKILFFLLLFFIFIFFSYFLAVLTLVPFYGKELIFNLNVNGIIINPDVILVMKILQLFSQLGMLLSVVIFAVFAGGKFWVYLQMNKSPKLLSVLLILLLLIVSVPLINLLGSLNAGIKLPASMSGLEYVLKNYEEKNNTILTSFLKTETITGLLFNIFMIGLFTAVVEEFVFRGVLLKLFLEWTKSTHLAVIISGFLFAFIHFQFYKFIPMFLFGLFLGYLYVWSKTIWFPVLFHFFNNSMSVVFSYLQQKGVVGNRMETVGVNGIDWIWVLISTIAVIFLTYSLFTYEKKENVFIDTPI